MATVTILKIRLLSQSPTPEIQNIKLNALVADNPQTENQRLDYGTQLLVTNDPVFFSMDTFNLGIPKIVFISLRFSMTEAESQNYQNSLQTDIVILDSIMDTRRHVDTRIRGDRAPSKSSELQDC